MAMSQPALDLNIGRAPEALYKKPLSYDNMIRSRRKIRIDPIGGSTTWSNPNNERMIRFVLASNNDAFDLFASYLCFTLTTVGTQNSVEDLRRYLASGGLHSLFSRVAATTMSGMAFDQKQDYDKQAAFFNKLYKGADELDGSLFPEGASMGKELYSNPYLGLDGYQYKCAGTGNGAIYDNSVSGTSTFNGATPVVIAANNVTASSVITLTKQGADADGLGTQYEVVGSRVTGTSFAVVSVANDTAAFEWVVYNGGDDTIVMSTSQAAELVVGDEILIRDPTTHAPVHQAIVASVSTTTVTFSPELTRPVGTGFTVWRKPIPARTYFGSATAGVKCYFKPFLNLFMLDSYWPAWLTDGINMEFDLNTADRSIVFSGRQAPSATVSRSFTITLPHFYVQAVQYDDVTKAAWEKQWRSGEGILFHARSYNFMQQQIDGAGPTSLTIPISCEALSLKAIYSFIQSSMEWSNSPSAVRVSATQCYDPNAKYYDAGVSTYQYRQGSNLYPPAPVHIADTGDAPMVEAWAELLEAIGAMYMSHSMSIPFHSWFKLNSGVDIAALSSTAVASSHRCIMAANLSNYDGPFGGTFTRNNRYFNLDLVCSAAFNVTNAAADANSSSMTRRLCTITERDSLIQLQADVGAAVYA